MPDSLMYQEDVYVVLEADQPEIFLAADELLAKLQAAVATLAPEDLPRDLQALTADADRARYLLANYCELDLGAGRYLQWYVTRLEK